jgi:hypothetical protein
MMPSRATFAMGQIQPNYSNLIAPAPSLPYNLF